MGFSLTCKDIIFRSLILQELEMLYYLFDGEQENSASLFSVSMDLFDGSRSFVRTAYVFVWFEI